MSVFHSQFQKESKCNIITLLLFLLFGKRDFIRFDYLLTKLDCPNYSNSWQILIAKIKIGITDYLLHSH